MKYFFFIKKILCYSLILSAQFIFSQNQKNSVADSIEIKIKNYDYHINFKAASTFFIEKNWDSTLVYTARLVDPNSSMEINDYCHYYRGVSFQMKKIFDEAEKEFNQISKKFDFYYLSRIVLGEIASEQENFQKAIHYFEEVDQLNKDKIHHIKTSYVKHNIGICYLHLEKFEKAKKYLFDSNSIYTKAKDTIQLVSSYEGLANLYYLQYKDHLAIPYFLKQYELSKYVQNFELKSKAAINMSIVEENRKDFAKALTYRKEFEQWNDSLNNQNKIWETAQREKQDAIKEKQKEVIILEADNKTRIAERNGFIYSSIVLLILLGTGSYFYREKIKANKIIATQKEALNKLNATKDYLFSVVSHDLRSPVNALRKQHKKLKNQIAKNDLDSLEKTIDTSANISESMYGLLNNVLHWSLEQSNQLLFRQEKLALKPIIEHVVFDFENLASAKAISLKTTLDATIVANFDRESLKIVLRNLLDNAIKYTDEDGKIHIQTTATAHESLIEVTDTGKGFSSAQIEKINDLTTITMEKIDRSKGVGLGLLLCVTLIKKNKGRFSIEQNNPKGSIIKITLPKT